MILKRGTGQAEASLHLKCLDGLSDLGRGVLDGLRLIQYEQAKVLLRHQGLVTRSQRIAGNHDVCVFQCVRLATALGAQCRRADSHGRLRAGTRVVQGVPGPRSCAGVQQEKRRYPHRAIQR